MAHSHRTGRRASIAIVGGETLLGKEVHELLEARKVSANIQLVASFDAEDSAEAANKAAIILAAGKEEPIVMSSIEGAELGSAQIVILAASKESAHKVYEKIRKAKPAPVVIDLTGALEDLAESRLRAPMVEPPGFDAEESRSNRRAPGRHRHRALADTPAESPRDPPVRDRNLRAGERARQSRYRRAAKAGGRVALLQALAQSRIRCAGQLQYVVANMAPRRRFRSKRSS